MRRGLTTDVVVRTGAELADDIGFDAVTLSAIARRLGVRTPSLYSHVHGSTDLAARISAYALTELADQVSSALAGRSGRDAVTALLDTHADYMRRHPGRYAAMQQRIPPSTGPTTPELEGLTAARAAGRRHADLLRAVLRDYALTGDAEVHAVRLLSSVVQGFTTLDLAGSFEHSTPPSEESRRYIVGALDTMLRSGSTGQHRNKLPRADPPLASRG